MKLSDLKWAVGTFVEALRDPKAAAHVDCECHPTLGYRGPRRVSEPEGLTAPAPEDAGARDDAVRSGRSEAESTRR